jgi:hypothetical protein
VKPVNIKTVPAKRIALLLIPVTLWWVVDPQLSMCRLVRLKQIAVVPMKDLAKRSNNVQRVGWETVHRTCHVLPAVKDKPVPVEVLKMVAENVPRASLVKQKAWINVHFAPATGFNHKISIQVLNALHVQLATHKI